MADPAASDPNNPTATDPDAVVRPENESGNISSGDITTGEGSASPVQGAPKPTKPSK